MLDDHGIKYVYREYRRDPLSRTEIGQLLGKLGVGPQQVLRTGDRVFKELELTGQEPDSKLIELLAEHPTLLQRPIGVAGGRAVVGRPPERLLELASG